MIGSKMARHAMDNDGNVSVAAFPLAKCISEGNSPEASKDEVVVDLKRALDKLDQLQLWMAGAHVASAIDLIEKDGA